MTVDSQHYEPDVIERFLRSDLPEAELKNVERHIESCETCQQQLLDTAADGDWWTDASEFLIADEHDEANLTGFSTLVRPNEPDEDTSNRTDIRQIIAWLAPTDDPAMLGRIGTYEVAGVIGAGGMGVVLKGFDRALNRYVAIKILAPHLATSGAARRRFAREAQAAAAVVHDNVIAIHGVDEAAGVPYLVMPYVRGKSLQKRLDSASLNISEVLRISMQTARGLSAAHDQGLVHRDIKPANILLDGTTERVLLTDFGLARAADDASLTHSGVIAGTPYFMSPEQAEGSGIDHRSDLFSLGSVMYTMCTGRPPFRAETSWGILRRVSEATPTPIRELNPDVPAWLAGLVGKLLQKNADDRFQSADQLARLLEQCLAHVQQPTSQSLPIAAAALAETDRSAQSQRINEGWLLIAGLALGITMVVLLGRPWFVTGTSEPIDTSAKTTEPDSQSVPPSGELPSWNSTDDELNRLRGSIEKLDQQTSDFWK
jgi:serine/threonine-protein kinase